MLVPLLIFAHLFADFILQTKWVVELKHKGWPGLFLHGGSFFVAGLVVLWPHLEVAFLPILLLSLEHILQDWSKIQVTRKVPGLGIFWYFLDQAMHIGGVFVVSAVIRDVDPAPDNTTILFFMLASSVIVLTSAWRITVMTNWAWLIDYTYRWLWWGYAERLAMLVIVGLGGWIALPLAVACTLPRLVRSWQLNIPIWKQHGQLMEVGAGAVVSAILGLGIWNLLQYI